MGMKNSWKYLRKIIFKEINEMRKLFKIGDKVTIGIHFFITRQEAVDY